ncbi:MULTISPECIES: hypothetical protein [Pseudoalteromonas]|uniref:hypothetical protein n=1 Tax=Pseudoalteromonas TaxID=53246 RepID=UPI00057A61A8|nr:MULTISPECIES: hypothetical protein [Pseudoalteromonas]ATG58213.1 hypothetical protein CPA52_08140 [Pseudoalteromonas marina]
MESYVAILISAGFATSVGTIAVLVNYKVNQRNRKINNTLQIAKDYYQDHTFATSRMFMWEKFIDLPKNHYDWEDLIVHFNSESKPPELNSITEEDLIALNRVIAFYKMVAGLIENREVDVPLLKSLFSFNYNRYWQPVRDKFETHTNRNDKALFVKIPELEETFKL